MSTGPQKQCPPCRRRRHFRPGVVRAGGKDEGDEDGQDRAGMLACHCPFQPRYPFLNVLYGTLLLFSVSLSLFLSGCSKNQKFYVKYFASFLVSVREV